MGLIVVSYQGKVPPKAYLEKVYATNPTYFGLAVADKDEKGNAFISVMREENVPKIEEVIEMQEAYKANLSVMIFGDKPHLQEDWQPFELLTDKQDKLVVATFAVGKFPTFERKNSTHTAEFHATMEGKGVREKLLEVYDSLGGDIEDFSEELKSKVLTNKLSNLTTEGGILVLTAGERVQGYLANMTTSAEEDWGWVSDTLDKKAEPVADKAAEVQQPSSLLGKLNFTKRNKADKAGGTPVTAPAEATSTAQADRGTLRTDHGTGLGNADKERLQAPPGTPAFTADDEFEMVGPPAHLNSNGKLERWYKDTVGYVPVVKGSLRKERPKVPVKKLKKLGTIGDGVSRNIVEKTTDTGTKTITTVMGTSEPLRQTPDQPIAVNKADSSTDLVTSELSSSELNALTKGLMKMPTILKYFDMAQEEIPSPEISKEMDENRKSLNEQIGLDGGFERWNNMPRKWLMNLAGVSRKGLVLLLEEYRYNFLKQNVAYIALLHKTGTKDTTVGPTKPATVQATAPVQPATLPEPALTPSKTQAPTQTSSFGNMRIERRKRA